ncbi:dihydroxyacetone kinase subunit DhaK [Mycoplasmopsis pullorum]|uniref:dihydroxyacetone kinase subunit DhaK n=1 Tax=Mycoplasmopsis pullorum TaxID=48003 RepID=UPI00111BAB39|nr:dihydroxyacetone kinase subunit DhaK [Mycoplasmopsis pullorum]TNK92288.1 dihydroxyacetone kinase subunit DhaK [Mycoplasmopsis pullorum]
MKKLLNNVENVVSEMLKGVEYANPHVYKVEDFNVIARKEKSKKVALVSGGGAGHEPAHAGFVGKGMLDAAVSGEVFTSPTPDQVLKAIQVSDNGEGVLLIIKNYTGDVMNFEMAKEMAAMEDIAVEQVVVDDDIAVKNSLYTVGRRGVAGTVLVHKIAGAAAEKGYTLAQVKSVAEKVITNVKTLGMSLGGCTVPASGKVSFELAGDEIEMGLGIHGEPGTHREKLQSAHEHVKYMLAELLKESEIKDEEVVVLVNGLGATTLMELNIINKEVNEQLQAHGVKIYRSLVGNYMTSLEMPGFSISILKLDQETKELFDEPTFTTLF